MIWVLGIAAVFITVIALTIFVLRDRRAAAQRNDVDVETLLANLHRIDALYATELLDGPVRADLDDLTREAATTLRAPMAFMTLVDDRRQFFASSYGRGNDLPRDTDLKHSYCKHVVAGEAPFRVTDATSDERVSANLGTVEDGIRSYLGVPLRTARGDVIGSFCVVDTAPREWSADAQSQLEELAGRAMEIALRKPAG